MLNSSKCYKRHNMAYVMITALVLFVFAGCSHKSTDPPAKTQVVYEGEGPLREQRALPVIIAELYTWQSYTVDVYLQSERSNIGPWNRIETYSDGQRYFIVRHDPDCDCGIIYLYNTFGYRYRIVLTKT